MNRAIEFEGLAENNLVNQSLKSEEIREHFRQFLSVNNIDKSEYDLHIYFDGQQSITLNCEGCERDVIAWNNEELYEIRQPKNKEVRIWETDSIYKAFYIMMGIDTPCKYKRIY